ncbi:hypothetical protein [Pyrobaculum sp.]|uniref:hypothetical protein n=1 Tax=Pyrobaculum sp. TaxID=2004705 RepID=UPI003D12BC6C
MSVECRASVGVQAPFIKKEVEMSGDCEEVRKRIDTLISIEGELMKREVMSPVEYVKKKFEPAKGFAKSFLSRVKSAMMFRRRR